MVLPGQSRRREWNQAHGHRVHEGGHHVGHIHGHAVLAVQGGGRFLRQQQGVLQLAHDDLGVDDVQDAHCGVAEGDGDANGQDLPDQMAAAGGDIQGLCPIPVLRQISHQKQHGDRRARRDAQDGRGGAHLQAHADAQYIPRQRQTDGQFQKRLQYLGNRRRRHVALALGVAPHAGQQAHAEHRRSQRPDGLGRQAVLQKPCQALCLEEHKQGAHRAQDEKQHDGGAENLPLLVLPSLGMGLAGQLGDGQRQARRGEGQQEIVNLIGSVEIRLAGAAQDVVQGDFVEEPDKFHHNDSCGQDGGAAQEGLLFLIRHEAITSNYNRELGRRNLLPL